MGGRFLRTCCFAVVALLPAQSTVRAAIVETFAFLDVESISVPGASGNEARTVASSAFVAYTLGSLGWSGVASPEPDSLDPAVFPSWGADLGVRITHVPSGTQADVLLGTGGEFGPGPQAFAGRTRALNGWMVMPGDAFVFEFYEDFDDPAIAPDAIWSQIEFTLSDDFAAGPGPPAEGIVRFETRGLDTFATAAGEPGAEFFRISYGPGDGPAIAQAVLNTHAIAQDDVWFDSDEIGELPEEHGLFQVNRFDGVGQMEVSFESEDPDPTFAGDFAVLRLSFARGDFTPTTAIHFGIDTDGGFEGAATGDAFALLEPGLALTLLFEDGTLLAGELRQVRPDVEHAAWLDLDLAHRRLQADVDEDGDVDGNDLLQMLLHFGTSRLATHRDGDTDGNGIVDRADFTVWREQVGRRRHAGAGQPAAPIPEPSAVASAGMLIACWWLGGNSFAKAAAAIHLALRCRLVKPPLADSP